MEMQATQKMCTPLKIKGWNIIPFSFHLGFRKPKITTQRKRRKPAQDGSGPFLPVEIFRATNIYEASRSKWLRVKFGQQPPTF